MNRAWPKTGLAAKHEDLSLIPQTHTIERMDPGKLASDLHAGTVASVFTDRQTHSHK